MRWWIVWVWRHKIRLAFFPIVLALYAMIYLGNLAEGLALWLYNNMPEDDS